jgi:putative membrane protein
MKMRLETRQEQPFDRAYAQDMVTDHQRDVAAFERAATSAGDPDLKAWAAKALPTLKDHLRRIQGPAANSATPKT